MAGLKHAFVSPLLRNINFDTNQFKNFRPVSNLQFLSKLIERVVLKRLNTHFDNDDLNISQQYGYKKRSQLWNFACKTNQWYIAGI